VVVGVGDKSGVDIVCNVHRVSREDRATGAELHLASSIVRRIDLDVRAITLSAARPALSIAAERNSWGVWGIFARFCPLEEHVADQDNSQNRQHDRGLVHDERSMVMSCAYSQHSGKWYGTPFSSLQPLYTHSSSDKSKVNANRSEHMVHRLNFSR